MSALMPQYRPYIRAARALVLLAVTAFFAIDSFVQHRWWAASIISAIGCLIAAWLISGWVRASTRRRSAVRGRR